MGSPHALLADVRAAITSGSLSSLERWLDVVGWFEAGDAPDSENEPGEPSRLLSIREVMRWTGLGRTTLWNLEKAGTFPKRVEVTRGRVAYREADVAAWISERPAR
jgi:prophage regulatory protein